MMSRVSPVVLITGAGGMLGLKLAEVLAGEGMHVIAAFRSGPGRLRSLRGIRRVRLDITAPASLAEALRRFPHVDAVIHCAAMTDVNRCERDKRGCYDANIRGTQNVIGLARLWDADVIYISTPMVFSGRTGNYRETDRPRPKNYYAKTKAEGERAVLAYRRGLVVRVNPIGKRPSGAHPSFVQWFVAMARRNRPFHLFSDVFINPVSTTTLSHVISTLVRHFRPGILHIGSRDVVNKADIWQLVVRGFPKYSAHVDRLPVNESRAGKRAKRPSQMWLNVTRVRRLGYKMPSWKSEVRRVLREL